MIRLALMIAVAGGCAPAEITVGHATPASATPPAEVPRQIKEASDLVVHDEPTSFTLNAGDDAHATLLIDLRDIPIAAFPGAPLDDIARQFARVPVALRALVTQFVISPDPSPNDAAWTAKYGIPITAAMGASPSGKVSIFRLGLQELRMSDRDFFVRNLMHELGHCWSLREWAERPGEADAWTSAIARDPGAPSGYAVFAFKNSGSPQEDVAETTALYFLVRDTPDFATRRAQMPARFAILDARFAR